MQIQQVNQINQKKKVCNVEFSTCEITVLYYSNSISNVLCIWPK